MTTRELESILKKARVPEIPADSLEMFPRDAIRRIRQAQGRVTHPPRKGLYSLLVCITTAACAVALVVNNRIGLPERPDILLSGKVVQETLAMFPHQVRAIVQDAGRLKLVLSDKSDVPDSSPLYVKICDGRHCSSLVTFSGQEVAVAGQKVTVLADPRGGIILEGSQLLWSSAEPIAGASHLKIEAKNLDARTL